MTLNCNGQLIDLNTPKIMGILNLTPDSFYDGGKYIDVENALRQTEEMLLDGAAFIDIGAFSSKPGTEEISEEEESRSLCVNFLMHFFQLTLAEVKSPMKV